MGIKEEIDTFLANYPRHFPQDFYNKLNSLVTEIVDKEKKEFALECCKEMNENIKSMRSGISRDTLIENDFFIPAKFNSQLTATKLEGEK